MQATKKRLLIVFACFFTLSAFSQPFISEINAYKKADSVYAPANNAILFVGSSSIRLWKDYSIYFPGYPIINRGVGGASLPDIIRYTNDIIIPYKPKQIVVYCGENDFLASDTVTALLVTNRFKTLFYSIRAQLPKVHIAFVSIKPSPSRIKFRSAIIETNAAIEQFLKKQKRSAFINVWDDMVDANGIPLPDLFLKDSLHMNPNGYAIWQKKINPFLK